MATLANGDLNGLGSVVAAGMSFTSSLSLSGVLRVATGAAFSSFSGDACFSVFFLLRVCSLITDSVLVIFLGGDAESVGGSAGSADTAAVVDSGVGHHRQPPTGACPV